MREHETGLYFFNGGKIQRLMKEFMATEQSLPLVAVGPAFQLNMFFRLATLPMWRSVL